MARETMQTDAQGSGSPIVLVGGGLTGWASWIPHQARLATTHTAIRAQPVAVAYGLEDRPLPAGYGIRYESDALGAALDARGLSEVDLVAWSYGAMISLDWALGHADRVRTLTLIEPPAMWVLDETRTLDAEAARGRDELRALYATMTVDVTEQQLATFVRSAGLVPPGKSADELPPWKSWVAHRRSLRTGDATWLHRDTAARLRAFDRPVLLVKGTGSSHFLHRITDGLAATLPRAKVVEMPGGHGPQIAAMDAFLDLLGTFISTPTTT